MANNSDIEQRIAVAKQAVLAETELMHREFGRARTEISGGVTLDRLPALAATGATFVSVGALTHSAPAADLSFEI